MGRTDYIVQAGIGFDLDRSSAKKSIGIFEGMAGQLNKIAAKSSKDQFAKSEADYDASMKKTTEINKKADKDLKDSVKASAQATQKALQAAAPPRPKAMEGKLKGKDLKEYAALFKTNMLGMGKSYSKFVKEADKIGIKVRKAKGGFGTGQSTTDFGKDRDVETRTRLVKLTERMLKDEKAKLALMKDTDDAYDDQLLAIRALERQGKAMRNLNDDIIQQEKQTDKVKRASAKAERKAERTKLTMQKRIMIGLKQTIAKNRELGRLATESAGKFASGLKNAFVIGTAAATAFFYKMQPLAATVTEFERVIINANSVFNVTRKELHSVSDEMVSFTLKYGVSASEMAEGLYQLASAGLTAAESQEVLQHTMKLAMATQGDHNALAKLTVQTIMGFGMTMEDSGMLVDKFAHSIQKSLIEWDDLASSVKFAMPFFVATGQSIDELLGGLEVLTNRALEAGIAGRGLRQALAQFAKHADDNTSALSKMGVEIMDSEGNMRALHEITLDAQEAFGDVTDLEALTAMLEDMNVRGATAFALLVQNADEFEAAVGNIANSAGEATLMADIQQESLAMQIERVKNALMAPFLFSDKVGEANETLNEFTYYIKQLVDEFVEFFIVLEDGEEQLSKHAADIQHFVVEVLKVAVDVIRELKTVFLESDEGLETFTDLITLSTKPMMIMLGILEKVGPKWIEYIVWWKVLTSVLPITNMWTILTTYATAKLTASMIAGAMAEKVYTKAQYAHIESLGVQVLANEIAEAQNWKQAVGIWAVTSGLITQTAAVTANGEAVMITTMTWKAFGMAMLASVALFSLAVMTSGKLSDALLMLAAAVALVAIVYTFEKHIKKYPLPVAIAAGVAMTMAMFAARDAIQNKMGLGGGGSAMGTIGSNVKMGDTRTSMDLGGTYMPSMDNGGYSTEHGMAYLQKGERVISKTSNMLEGLTINMGDVMVQDGEDFAERVAEALPNAIRQVSDSGGI